MLLQLYIVLAVVRVAIVQGATAHQHEALMQVASGSYSADAEADRIVDLPGLGKPDFGLFSG
jgi:hypothetical protein